MQLADIVQKSRSAVGPETRFDSQRLATTASLDEHSPDNQLVDILEGLLVHPATVSDEALQATAVESLQTLVGR